MKRFSSNLLLSIAGGIILLLILIAVNFVASIFHYRQDFTEDQAYTLTSNTKRILSKLDTPVTIKFYFSRSLKQVPVVLKNYANDIENLLNEYQIYGNGNIILEKYDPKPDSDAEDSANLDGIKGQSISTGDRMYMGIAVTCLDKTVTIPFASPTNDNLLEYDITSAITQVFNNEKPVIGIMSALEVMGQKFSPQMLQMGQMANMEPWMFVTQLKKDFEVRQVSLEAKEIDKDIQLLIVIHPAGIKPATEFAIDQFIMNGGKLIAFVDPASWVAFAKARQDRNFYSKLSSNMPTLLKSWGIIYDDKKVVADMRLAYRLPKNMEKMATFCSVLDISQRVLNHEDIITSKLSNLRFVYSGNLGYEKKDGLTITELVNSTQDSCLIDSHQATQPETAFKNFKRDDEIYNMALMISGKFKTAFPNGAPKEESKDKKDEKTDKPKEEVPKEYLKESKSETMVLLISDSDLLTNDICVRVQRFLNQEIVMPLNENLQFVQNMADFAGGDRELIGIRCRQKENRPFEVVKDMQAKAEQKFKEKLAELEKELKETERKVNALQINKSKDQQFILSPKQKAELQSFQEKRVEIRKKLKTVSKELRRDIDFLQLKYKIINIALIPFIVIIFGLGVAFIRMKRSAAK